MLKTLFGAAVVIGALGTGAEAATLFTSGAGSAVTTVDASADFESALALNSTYTEDGMSFTGTGNFCGYAGCPSHSGFFSGATPFTGNYIYQADGYTIEAAAGSVFFGLELILGSGYASGTFAYSWATYLGGMQVSSGEDSVSIPSVHGWSDSTGFDTLVFSSTSGYAAFDSVKAQYSLSAVPLPATGLLLLGAFGGLAALRRRKASQA